MSAEKVEEVHRFFLEKLEYESKIISYTPGTDAIFLIYIKEENETQLIISEKFISNTKKEDIKSQLNKHNIIRLLIENSGSIIILDVDGTSVK